MLLIENCGILRFDQPVELIQFPSKTIEKNREGNVEIKSKILVKKTFSEEVLENINKKIIIAKYYEYVLKHKIQDYFRSTQIVESYRILTRRYDELELDNLITITEFYSHPYGTRTNGYIVLELLNKETRSPIRLPFISTLRNLNLVNEMEKFMKFNEMTYKLPEKPLHEYTIEECRPIGYVAPNTYRHLWINAVDYIQNPNEYPEFTADPIRMNEISYLTGYIHEIIGKFKRNPTEIKFDVQETQENDHLIIRTAKTMITQCGTGSSRMEKIETESKVNSNDETEENTVSYTNNENNSQSYKINKRNQLLIQTDKKNWIRSEVVFGYKAAKYKQNGFYKHCVIKLLISDAIFAMGREETKVRCNKAVPIKIVPVIHEKIWVKSGNPHAQNPTEDDFPVYVENVRYDFDNEQDIAYSCVVKDDFVYKLNNEVYIHNFDSDLDKVCVPGIHFYFQQQEVFSWFGINHIAKEDISGFDEMENFQPSEDFELQKSNLNELKQRHPYFNLNNNMDDSN